MLLLGISAPRFCGAVHHPATGFGLAAFTTTIRKGSRAFLSSAAAAATTSEANPAAPQKIPIVGGGLAGLSTAFHLLEQANIDLRQEQTTRGSMKITIFDKANGAGLGGASAMAGGYVRCF